MNILKTEEKLILTNYMFKTIILYLFDIINFLKEEYIFFVCLSYMKIYMVE